MTDLQAQMKASAIWGKFGFAIQYNTSQFEVGVVEDAAPSMIRHLKGAGESWEEAFAAAEHVISVGRNPKVKSKWAILRDGEIFPGPDGNPSKFAYYQTKKEALAVVRDGLHLQQPKTSGNGGFARMNGFKP